VQTRIQAYLVPLTLAVAQPVQRQMRGDPKQPRCELCGGLISGPRAVDPQKRILRQFLSDSLVLDHPEQEPDHGRPVFLQQQIQAPRLSCFQEQHQLGVGFEDQCR
jgi:hypothetical protein